MFPIGWQSYPMGGKVAPVYGTKNAHFLRQKSHTIYVTHHFVYISERGCIGLPVSLRDTRPLEGSYGELDIRKMNCVTNTDAVFRDH